MRIICILAFLIILTKCGLAQTDFQPGYIITLHSDTLAGVIDAAPEKIRKGACAFRRTENASLEIFTPAMIRGFGLSEQDQLFVSYELPSGELVFADMLFRGRADLFYFDGFFYVQKDAKSERIDRASTRESNVQGGRYTFAHKTYIGTLNRYFSDCLPDRLLRGEVNYSARDFVSIFRQYTECSGSEYHIFKKRRQTRTIRFHVLAGINMSSLKFPERDLDIFKTDQNFFLGGGVSIPLISTKLFLTSELTWARNVYHGKRSGYAQSGSVQKDYTVSVSMIKIPLGLKYVITSNALSPYMRAGLLPFFPIDGHWSIYHQGTSEAEFNIGEKTASLVYWGGLGVEKRIRRMKSAFVEFRMEKFDDYIGFYGPNGPTNIPSTLLNKLLVFGMNF